MNPQNEDKKMLIQSMKKLVTHVFNNPQRQNEIFDALSHHDLNKIILNLQDDNEYLRRISSLLLCELFYQNNRTKTNAAKMLGIQPPYGRICVSGISESIKKYPSTLKKCIELMQSPATPDEQNKMCWIINLERKGLKIQVLDYKKYSSFTFIDPLKNLFGFTLNRPQKQSEEKITETFKKKQIGRNTSLQTEPILENRKPQSVLISTQPSSQFYKQFIQSRNRSKQSKRDSLNMNYINSSLTIEDQDNRLRYTQPLKTQIIASHDYFRKQDLRRSLQIRKPIQAISSQPSKNNNTDNKISTSYQNIDSPCKPIQTSKVTREKQKDLRTDRKLEFKQPRPSTGSARYQILDRQQFHKRVKEILKK